MADRVIHPRVYAVVFVTLLVLTFITLGLSRLPLGGLHLWIGLVIAVVKAVLVILYFMHMIYYSRLIWVVGASGIFFLGILIVLTMNDYLTRNM